MNWAGRVGWLASPVQVWDRLLASGEPHGIEPGGYRVLESLRLEKGYRYFGTDLTAGDTPTRRRSASASRSKRVSSTEVAPSQRRVIVRRGGSARCS
jgi:hypothetical protein